MTLVERILSDANTVFLRQNHFAEELVYYRGYGLTADSTEWTADSSEITADATLGSDARTINGIVRRDQLAVVSEDGDTVLPVWHVWVANDSTDGIASSELDLGGDQLVFPPRYGQDEATKRITRLLAHDSGMLLLECR